MILGWPLTFLRQGQICIPIQNVEKFSQNVLKTYGWNLQYNYMIKVVKLFSYYHFFSPGVTYPCPWVIYLYKIM